MSRRDRRRDSHPTQQPDLGFPTSNALLIEGQIEGEALVARNLATGSWRTAQSVGRWRRPLVWAPFVLIALLVGVAVIFGLVTG